jgi:YggT family protein
MRAFLYVVDLLLAIYTWVLFAHMALYWLIGFRVFDGRIRSVAIAHRRLSTLAEPASRPIRLIVPRFGGVDSSPLGAVLLIVAARYVIAIYILPRLLP